MAGDTTPQWLRPLEAAAGPRYLQIVNLIEGAVEDGSLRPGDRLPPQRSLAELLDVDLTTVTRAYAEARHRNLLDAVTGRGSFVSARKEQFGPPIDLSMNIPPAPKGVRLAELMQRGIAEVLARSSADLLMTYHVGPGALADRAAGCAWLEPILGRIEPQRLVISPGAQPALVALLTNLAAPGATILTEPLTYPGLLAAARQRGLHVVPVAADGEGILPEALERAAREHGARLLCLTPTIQNPTTITMPEQRRREIARIARAHDLTIIEDDPYSLLAGDAPPPFAVLAPERTYHVSTLSKGLTPGLRTAFVVIPAGAEPDALTSALRALTLMPAPLMTALATHWIRVGAAGDLLKGVREEAAARQVLARAILPASAQAHPNGLHVWQPLPAHWDRYRLIEAVRQQGLGVTPSDAFSVEGRAPDAVRISLGGVPERARLVEALKTLAATLGDQRSRTHVVV
ncbi:PLP-dependent aminotransferase family protein [Bosea caraganae]|uniref:PLP-dependent aminotransferase family protein n=1 Tax=Bosea caraganae TaxID=2763117 RepID=A0A370L282_9HYPH|nr:PLP-dependent aminotransferase family protein [Bosea caraganae]RDJ22218.1 PLP-dependent aminotransferase family protein [Bosea caraganae]RDJ22695.1 PLP-dependent aminotransferase family protein [Bosea caraganae]